MAVQYAFSQITTTGLKLAVDAADPLSYPGSGTSWTDVTGNGFTGTISSSISFATTNRGALVSSNSASAVSFSGSAADFGQGSFTVEMAFLPSQINGRHWLYSKNSGSFPNFGAFITGSGGSGRITAFYNVSSTISSSATTAVGSIVTGSNYLLDVTYIPNLTTAVYINSNLVTSGTPNGTGSLTTSASLLLLNNTTSSNSGSVGNLYNFKVYNPYINPANIRKNYNSMCSRFGLPLALYTPYAPLLLDNYTGASAAYSLRRLSDFYGGSAIRVRRSSDNTEQNIGFDTSNNLDTTSLLSFCGAGNGFVTTWYDQSGNSRDISQSTAANQPQIVNNGSLITLNSKTTIQFNNTQLLTRSSFNVTSVSIFTLLNKYAAESYGGYIRNVTSTGNSFAIVSSLPPTWVSQCVAFVNGVDVKINPTSRSGAKTLPTNQYLENWIYNDTVKKLYENNTDITTTTGQINWGGNLNFTLGSIDYAGNAANNKVEIQELLIYDLDQSSNRTGISSNINSYYSIY
jgi:hypothetical protein